MVVKGQNVNTVEAARRQKALLEALAAIPEPPDYAEQSAPGSFLRNYAEWFARFDQVRPGERIAIQGDVWRCLCWNENHLDGYDPVMRDGSPVGACPEPWTAPFWQCRRCGRIIRASDGFVIKGDTTEEEISRVVELAKQQITDDVAKGVVPATVPNFAALHDYVDANLYGEGACEYRTADDVDRVMAPAQDRLNDWILSGALRTSTPEAIEANLQGAEHSKDEDCTVVDGQCTVCHVEHGDPCLECGGCGFHKPECPRMQPDDGRVFDCQRFTRVDVPIPTSVTDPVDDHGCDPLREKRMDSADVRDEEKGGA